MKGFTSDPWERISRCTCYVCHLDDEARFTLRLGAHDPACPVYSPSLDRVDAIADAEYRQQATGVPA